MAVEPDVHLVLSRRAAEDLDRLMTLALEPRDGSAIEHFDDPDATWAIFESIHEEINAQLPAKKKPAKRKPVKKRRK